MTCLAVGFGGEGKLQDGIKQKHHKKMKCHLLLIWIYLHVAFTTVLEGFLIVCNGLYRDPNEKNKKMKVANKFIFPSLHCHRDGFATNKIPGILTKYTPDTYKTQHQQDFFELDQMLLLQCTEI
jgi:hypothetical protein